MLVEYVAFGALVLAALVASFFGMRRRRADTLLDPSATLPFMGDGGSGSTVRPMLIIPADFTMVEDPTVAASSMDQADRTAADRTAVTVTDVRSVGMLTHLPTFTQD